VYSIELLRDWYQKGWFGKNYFSLTNEQGFARIADGSAGMSPNGFWAFQWIDGHFNQTGQTPAITPFPTLLTHSGANRRIRRRLTSVVAGCQQLRGVAVGH